MQRESKFQSNLIKKIKKLLPDAIVMKNDSGYIQGIPDLIILNGDKWAALECKRSENSKHRPNQDFYVDKMNNMSFAAFAYPENEKEILDAIQRTLRDSGTPRVSKS